MVAEPIPDAALFQQSPPFSKPSLYRAKGWTETTAGYIREANKLKTCIVLNERLSDQPYTWHLTIAFEADLTPEEIKAYWSKASLKLKRSGVVAVWVMEVSRANHVHFHLVLRSQISRAALEQAVEAAMPARAVVGWHKCLQRIESGETWRLAHYVTKAKVAGWVNGRQVKDFYATKRLLFKPRLGLHKTGTIGGFWVKPKAAIWKDVTDREARIADGLDQPHVRELAEHVYVMLDGTVRLERIERAFGYHAGSEAVRRWVERLIADERGYQSDSSVAQTERPPGSATPDPTPRSAASRAGGTVPASRRASESRKGPAGAAKKKRAPRRDSR